MNESMERALRELLDREAIRALLARYAHSVDRRDLLGVASCFTADAAYKGSLGEGGINVALGALEARMQQYRSTMHFLGTQSIELAGDSATSETYAIAYHQRESDEGPRNVAVGVRYMDILTRTPDGWRICRREVSMEWQRFDEIV